MHPREKYINIVYVAPAKEDSCTISGYSLLDCFLRYIDPVI